MTGHSPSSNDFLIKKDACSTFTRRTALGLLAGVGAAGALQAWAAPENPKNASGEAQAPKRLSTKPFASETSKPEKRSFIIATTNPAALAYLPLTVALKKGFFGQRGLDVELVEHQSSARAMQVVGSGQADALCGWLENALSPAGRALALQSYCLMGRAPMMALGVSASLAANLRSKPAQPQNPAAQPLAQLKGRLIGVAALNSPTHTVALAALRRAGITASEARFVSVGSAASAAAALRSGQIEALIHMDPLMMQLEQRGEIEILADLRSPEACLQTLGSLLPSSCLAASADFAQRYPNTLQASADAMLQALQWLSKSSLRDVLSLWPEGEAGMDAQLLVASLVRLRSAYSPDGQCPSAYITALWQAMIEAEPTLRLQGAEPLRSSSNVWMQSSAARLMKT